MSDRAWADVSKMKLTTEFLTWGHRIRIQLSTNINDLAFFSVYLAAWSNISQLNVKCIHLLFPDSQQLIQYFYIMKELTIISTKFIPHTGTTTAYLRS